MAKGSDKFRPVLVELRPSKIAPNGIGVFAIAGISKNTKIFEGVHIEYFSQQVSWLVFVKLPRTTQRKILAFCVGTPQGFIPPDNYDFNNLSIEWYLNHSCEGNIGFDNLGDFVAIKKIKAGEELSYDYGLVESNPKFRMSCTCGSSRCREFITGNDWKWLKKDINKFQIMHPYLKVDHR